MQKPYTFVIDTRDRTSVSTSSSDFYINLSPAIQQCTKISLLGVTIPNTIYNITTNSRRIEFDEGGSTLGANIPRGSYDSTTILSAISTAMNNVGSNTYTATYDATTFKITITSSGSFQFHSGSSYSITNSINEYIGFRTTHQPGTDVTSDSAINLAGNKYLYIDINCIYGSVRSANSADTGTFLVPITASPNGEINYMFENTEFGQHTDINSNLTQLYIRLKSRDNTVVDLNGSDWVMYLRFDY